VQVKNFVPCSHLLDWTSYLLVDSAKFTAHSVENGVLTLYVVVPRRS